MKERGLRDVRLHDVLHGPLENEQFDSIILFGQNLGIAGFHENVGPYLQTLKSMLKPGGRIIGTQIYWNRTTKKKHLDFQQANREPGRFPAEIRLRISYGDIDEDFSWVLTDQEDLVEIAERAGLKAEAILDCGEMYGSVLQPAETESAS